MLRMDQLAVCRAASPRSGMTSWSASRDRVTAAPTARAPSRRSRWSRPAWRRLMTRSGREMPSLTSGIASVPPAMTSNVRPVALQQPDRLRQRGGHEVLAHAHRATSGHGAAWSRRPRRVRPWLTSERAKPSRKRESRRASGPPTTPTPLVLDDRPARLAAEVERRPAADRPDPPIEAALQLSRGRRLGPHESDHGVVGAHDGRQPDGDPAAILVGRDLVESPGSRG